jgi:hypothetical protein
MGKGASRPGWAATKLLCTLATRPARARTRAYLYSMSPEAIKQDFESAIVKHFSFKARLRSFLHGNGNEQGPLRDPDQCGMGQWITERRRGPYQHLPEMRELDRLHRLIHQQANRLMDLHMSGRREEALAGFGEVQVLADSIMQLLQTIEAKLRTAQA